MKSSETILALGERDYFRLKVAPYHPASNGAAENAVKTFKYKFSLLRKDNITKKEALARYLFQYRPSPHCTTGVSPAELQINRKFRTRLDLLKIRVGKKVSIRQREQARNFRGNRTIDFKIGDVVMAKDIRRNC